MKVVGSQELCIMELCLEERDIGMVGRQEK